MRDKILVIDDEPNLRMILEATLTRQGYEVCCFESFDAAKQTLNLEDIDLVLTDLQMPGASGMEVLNYCKNYSPDLPVILITAFGTIEAAVNALKAGAFDFVLKPFENTELFRIIEKALQSRKRRKKEPALDAMSAIGVGPIAFPLFGESENAKELRTDVDRIQKNDSPVMLYGEIGTGKRSIAYEFHRKSPRSRGPFVQLNLEAIPPVFQLTELFGVERGASQIHLFSKPGSLELAQGGTVFIEEVGELSVEAQNALFSALENETFSRVGGAKKHPMDFRLIVTSAKDLSEQVRDGTFHVELFYKLSIEHLLLSPVRERKDDLKTHFIPFFLERASRKKGICKMEFSKEAIEWLLSRSWPGNFGELERTIEKSVNHASGPSVELSDFV